VSLRSSHYSSTAVPDVFRVFSAISARLRRRISPFGQTSEAGLYFFPHVTPERPCVRLLSSRRNPPAKMSAKNNRPHPPRRGQLMVVCGEDFPPPPCCLSVPCLPPSVHGNFGFNPALVPFLQHRLSPLRVVTPLLPPSSASPPPPERKSSVVWYRCSNEVPSFQEIFPFRYLP